MCKKAVGPLSALIVLIAACGGAAVLTQPEGTPRPEPIRVQPEIVGVQKEDGIPTGITIELGDGSRLRLRLSDAINLDDWDLEHLEGHRRTSTAVFVTYEERPDEFVALELNE